MNPSAVEEEPFCNLSAPTECLLVNDLKGPNVQVMARKVHEVLGYCFFIHILTYSQPEKMAEYPKDIEKALK